MIIGFSFTCGKAFAPQFLHQHMTGRMKDATGATFPLPLAACSTALRLREDYRRGWSRLDGHRFRVASIGWMDRVT
jgi:hypothetical protein